MLAEPFEDSRRLTGCNVYFPGTGAALETARGIVVDDAAIARWRLNLAAACRALGWPDGDVLVRRHRSGASLVFAAPFDQLYAATEINEWAWWSAVAFPFSPREKVSEEQGIFHAPGHAAVWDEGLALQTLKRIAVAESSPDVATLQRAAAAHRLPFLPDDDFVSIGAGDGSATWPIDALPDAAAVDWSALHTIPTALVTGSNGKTTTVRLLAAMARAQGWRTAHSCTDGVFLDGQVLESGDFSGPTGARTALRQRAAQAAILETARGGMLRRGLAICSADAAVVTNIAADHFGEYGIHDLDDLAMVKLTVARAIGSEGLLVLNADDPVLVRQSQALSCPLGWFALDFEAQPLQAHRGVGGATCGVRDGVLLLHRRGITHDLGAIVAMPLTLTGRAAYNIANSAAAALAAAALGISAAAIAGTLMKFGRTREDNPGRLQHWRFGTLQVVLDYAHNPDGLRGLLHAVDAERRVGRLAIVLGHAGNREDADLRAVATTAAQFRPELIVLKDSGYERGRGPGEIAAIMRETLLEAHIDPDAVAVRLDEVQAARETLAWARDGDLLVWPIHAMVARGRVVSMLDRLHEADWHAGQALPDMPETPS